jgi:hypothetical protein
MATLNPTEWQCSECGTIYVEDVNNCKYGCKVAFVEELKPTHNSDYAVSPSATPKLPSFLSVCCYITENDMATSFESFYSAIKKLGNFA